MTTLLITLALITRLDTSAHFVSQRTRGYTPARFSEPPCLFLWEKAVVWKWGGSVRPQVEQISAGEERL